MRREEIRKAYDEVLPDVEERSRMLQSILLAASDAQPERTEIQVLKKKSVKKGAVIVLAAALALALSVTVLAYTTDLFGFRALQVPEPEGGYEPNPWISDDATRISITQPQDVPDDVYDDIGTEVAEGINGKLENNRFAWNEWVEWLNNNPGDLYKEFSAIEKKYDLSEWDSVYTEENEDGSATFECYTYEGDRTAYDPDAFKLEATVVMPAEEYQRYVELMNLMGEATVYEGKYDFKYGADSAVKEAKLEEIAAKYGLNLRGDMTLLWSSETAGMEGEGFYTNEELVDIVSDAACSGRLFNETPAGYDKVYYFDEGTFSVAWFANLPGRDETADCYGYNSVYGTLSSGSELTSYVDDIDSYTSRKHTCPDGTEVTILSNGGNNAFIYVYLEDSFFAVRVSTGWGILDTVDVYMGNLTDEDLDYIADSINYSVIGK